MDPQPNSGVPVMSNQSTAIASSPLDEAIAAGQMSRDPYPVYQKLRADHPVCRSERWDCWVLSRHADISAVLQDTKRFSNTARVVNGIRRSFPGESANQLKPIVDHYSKGLINCDPPDHTRTRKMVQATFSPRTVDRLRPHVDSIISELLDRVQSSGKMDVIRDLAYPLPVRVIAELMGIPVEMQDQFKAWSCGTIEFQATPRPTLEVALRSQSQLMELRNYFRSVFAERRKEPREDLISELVNQHLDNQKLSEEELLSACVSILIGGHETTTTLIASGMWLLLNHPQAMRELRDDPSLGLSAMDEFLRFEPPFQRIVRVAMCDMDYQGQPIRQGQTVMLLIGSANRDEAVFPNPEKFDIRRSPNKHVSFGYGVHYCLGAGLAKIEVPAAINALLKRMPNLRLDQEAELKWADGMVRTLTRLPVQF